MRKAFRHTGVLMMLGVVALGLIGAAYTLWYENLELTATVSTGTFDVDGSVHGAAVPVVSLNNGGTYLTTAQAAVATGQSEAVIGSKMPSCTQAVGTDTDPANNNDDQDIDNNVVQLTASNLYPFAGCRYIIDIHNTGTVPAHVALTNVTLTCTAVAPHLCPPPPLAPWTNTLLPVSVGGTSNLAQCQAFLGAIATWNGNDVEIPGIQLHAGNELACEFILALDQADVEGTTWVFTASYTAHQWNEDIVP